jgi:hypothetical protein
MEDQVARDFEQEIAEEEESAAEAELRVAELEVALETLGHPEFTRSR